MRLFCSNAMMRLSNFNRFFDLCNNLFVFCDLYNVRIPFVIYTNHFAFCDLYSKHFAFCDLYNTHFAFCDDHIDHFPFYHYHLKRGRGISEVEGCQAGGQKLQQ